jgi:rare lipoprotein A
VNDRGPYVDGRVIDLSKTAAKQIGVDKQDVAPVIVEAKPPE